MKLNLTKNKIKNAIAGIPIVFNVEEDRYLIEDEIKSIKKFTDESNNIVYMMVVDNKATIIDIDNLIWLTIADND